MSEHRSQTALSILVSGGNRGLGAAMVQRLLDEGHHVATFSRSRTELIDELETCEAFLYRAFDARDTAAMIDFVEHVEAAHGGIDVLVNNAGLAYDGILALMDETRIDNMIDVNLKASILLAKECSRVMLRQSKGCIINISSIIAERGFSGLAGYAATKAGMIGLTRSLARELGPRSIRVNAIAPGFLTTDMSSSLDVRQLEQIRRRTPLGRLGTVDDVAGVVSFLISPAASFITGQVITVDGGSSL